MITYFFFDYKFLRYRAVSQIPPCVFESNKIAKLLPKCCLTSNHIEVFKIVLAFVSFLQGSLVQTDLMQALNTDDWDKFPLLKKGQLVSRIEGQERDNKEERNFPTSELSVFRHLHARL